MKKLNPKGFTILELMIAVTVLAVLLLITSSAVIAMSRQFYKGLAKSRTQQVARNISEELATNIQYSTSEPRFLGLSANGEVEAWCIAERSYLFVEGKQLGSNPTTQSAGVMLRGPDCNLPSSIPDTLTPGPNQVELVGEGMRLADLDICPSNTTDPDDPCYATSDDVWTVKVRIVYGDNDLVCSPAAGDCEDTTISLNQRAGDLNCKLQTGNQFCATAEYQATVVRRL